MLGQPLPLPRTFQLHSPGSGGRELRSLSRLAEPRSRIMPACPWQEYHPHPSSLSSHTGFSFGAFPPRASEECISFSKDGERFKDVSLVHPREEKTPPPLFLTAAPNSLVPAPAAGGSGFRFKGWGTEGKVFRTRTNFFQKAQLPLTRRRGTVHPPPRELFCQ